MINMGVCVVHRRRLQRYYRMYTIVWVTDIARQYLVIDTMNI